MHPAIFSVKYFDGPGKLNQQYFYYRRDGFHAIAISQMKTLVNNKQLGRFK